MVFPAPAGMNRPCPLSPGKGLSVPRACGDEPPMYAPLMTCARVFPAPAGMNRIADDRASVNAGVPRACGDEPDIASRTTGGD